MLKNLKVSERRVSTLEDWERHDITQFRKRAKEEREAKLKQLHESRAAMATSARRHATWVFIAFTVLCTATYELLAKGLLPHVPLPLRYRAITDWMLTEDFQLRFTYLLLGASAATLGAHALPLWRRLKSFRCTERKILKMQDDRTFAAR